jgi:hypothetical protein
MVSKLTMGCRVAGLAFALSLPSLAQSQDPCVTSDIVTAPNRPNLAAAADVTECGLLELEQGWTRVNGPRDHDDVLNSTLRYGLGHNLDVRWGADLMNRESEAGESREAVGDTAVAVRYQFWKQSPRVPSMAVQYGAKLATAGPVLGTGYGDNSLGFLASKDFGKLHLDYNLVHAWLGTAGGTRPYTYTVAALSRSLYGPLGVIVEFCGDLQPVGYPVGTFALTYKIGRRLTLDGGATIPLGSSTVRNQVLLGFTYAIWKYHQAAPTLAAKTGAD